MKLGEQIKLLNATDKDIEKFKKFIENCNNQLIIKQNKDRLAQVFVEYVEDEN